MSTEIIIVIISIFVFWTTYTTWGVFIWEMILVVFGYRIVGSVASTFKDAWLRDMKKPTKFQRFLMDHEYFVKFFVRFFSLITLFVAIVELINNNSTEISINLEFIVLLSLPFIIVFAITKRTNLDIPTR